ncbi:hypothetical protein [Candidatus Mycoplasma mahonii]|uniref:hypothetical protein n=1 Tax=Candidatus Mycoplasma mahonii TaxID=3004105 RepID=UPI0026F10CA8|nr:hypothetical protein [Candidatus Mycoplasma mahonii]WKX02729.1 hypothetical protein O3I44_01475 [Candidatus Mycoplasma mahonii]
MTIDLHGYTEEESIPVILGAFLEFESNPDLTIELITGNGYVLRDVAIELIEEEGLVWSLLGKNTGALMITKK